MGTPYRMVATVEEALSLFDKRKPLFTDTETVGFYGRVSLLQLFQEGHDEVIMVRWPDPFMTAVNLSSYHSVWHNAHYDVTTIQAQTSTRWCPDRLDCTFYLARLALPQLMTHSLDVVMAFCVGLDPYIAQGLNKKVLQKTDWGKEELTDEQLQYAATDVYHMPAVWNRVSVEIESNSYKLDMHALRKALDFQNNGVPVCQDAVNERLRENNAKIAEYNMPININSWQQVRPYIGEERSDDLALAEFSAEGNERAKAVRAVRKLTKQNSFLIKKFNTPRIYGKFAPSAKSGRFTCKDQNLQQLPRALKGVFRAPKGRVFVHADYAQLELRTICAITRCKLMEKLFREGKDLHGYTAEMLFGADYTPEHRQLSKNYNFGYLLAA